jgi:hypothetical protein
MKNFSCYFLFFLIVCSLSAEDRKKSVAVKEDQGALFITNYDINVNCCSKFESDLKIEDKKIIITDGEPVKNATAAPALSISILHSLAHLLLKY